MRPWKRTEPTKLDKIGWRTVITKTFEMPNGQIIAFQTVGHENSHCVATVALTPDLRVVVANQFRPGPEKVLEELPGGGVEKDDKDFEAAARRELSEETGYEAGKMQYLGYTYQTAYHNSTWHYFLATDCEQNKYGQQLDDNEYAEVRLITIDQLLDNAGHGQMTDVSGVFLAYDLLMQYKETLNEKEGQ